MWDMAKRRPKTHVIIIDGTQSRLDDDHETNAGLLYKLLDASLDKKEYTVWYDPGIQGHGFWNWVTIASGLGINKTIRRAYGRLASKYRAGDKVFLFGYSRGAYAVRSLAGWINRLGLIERKQATQARIDQAFRHYECESPPEVMQAFCDEFCIPDVQIEMIGVWDTVKALGLPYPLLSRMAPMATEFHNDRIGKEVRFAFHALAIDETRTAYTPVMWDTETGWDGHLEQVWFRGCHADVGGHVWRLPAARPLSNIPLVWMLERAEACGLPLIEGWRKEFPMDANAPAVGNRRGISKFFIFRAPRLIGEYPNENLHPSTLPDPESEISGEAKLAQN